MIFPWRNGQPQRTVEPRCISSSQGFRTTTTARRDSLSNTGSSNRPHPPMPTALPQARNPSSKVLPSAVTIVS
ncbi:hypothetical protein WME98_41465 [Sorangium sp. So ce296]